MEGGGRQTVSFKYTASIQRPGARAQGLGKMVTNTEVSAQDKAEDGKDLDTRDPRNGGKGIKPGRPCMLACPYTLDWMWTLSTCYLRIPREGGSLSLSDICLQKSLKRCQIGR